LVIFDAAIHIKSKLLHIKQSDIISPWFSRTPLGFVPQQTDGLNLIEIKNPISSIEAKKSGRDITLD
jgi:hypothetical protein